MKNYSIGLDIGTASVGWSVVDENLNIIRKSGKNLMGVRLFDSGNTAVVRRTHRATRRRIARRKQRIQLLRTLFENEILPIDENFFRRMDNSFLWMEDKKQETKNILFEDETFDDKAYHQKYPTIYHLRKELLESDEKIDIRLLYLAVHHMIKFRGHFIYEEADFNTESGISKSIEKMLESISDFYDENMNLPTVNEVQVILLDKNKKKGDKQKEIVDLFDKQYKKEITEISKAIVGYKANFPKIFMVNDSDIKYNKSFSEELEDSVIMEITGDDYYLFESIEQVYSGFILSEILGDEHNISSAMVQRFNKHKKDKKHLKSLFKITTLKEYYKSIFHSKKAEKVSYTAYINNESSCSNEQLNKSIKAILEKYKVELSDNKDYIYCIEQIEKEDFLKKIRSKENVGIPYQLHKQELEQILVKQSKFYPSLDIEKILSILTFKIPYYVGPLVSEDKSEFAWMERLTEGEILPWNYKDVIDIDKTAEKFIRRMTNKCTYLPKEDVIPKNSILYSEFILLNELNKVRIGGKLLSMDLKRDIIRDVFKKYKNVTIKKIKDYLNNSDIAYSTKQGGVYNYDDEITGTQQENKFASSLTSYIDFEKIFGEGYVEDNPNKVEKIIEWLTIYNSKEIIRKQITKKYPEITKEQIKKILKKSYSGWSRLSARLLDGIKGNNVNHVDLTIINIMRKSNYNFMEIVNDDEFGFNDKINEIRLESNLNSTKVTYKEDIESLPTSPANKKGIWQSVKIVDEIIKIMSKGKDKNKPQRIYIEMARDNQEKKRTTSRRKMLDDLYKKIKNDSYFDYKIINDPEVVKDERIESSRLFLYLTQNGKCMYTGKPLHINQLSNYHIDHIIPQSFIKDDSFNNKVLVIAKANMDKLDQPVNSRMDIPKSVYILWENLEQQGLISKIKHNNLKKTSFSEQDYKGFISRQLVETRQISKHVLNIFKDYKYAKNVVSVKAQLTSSYRKANKLYKIRNLNDLHHAHDAYITCVVGKHIFDRQTKFTWKNYLKESTGSKYGFVIGGLNKNIELSDKVRKVLAYKNVLITKQLKENSGEDKGGFWKSTIHSNTSKGNNKIPLKENLSPEKYGFYTSENRAYCIAIEAKKGKKVFNRIVGVPVNIASSKNLEVALDKFIKDSLDVDEYKILKDKIYLNQLFIQGGSEFYIASEAYLHTATQLFLDNKFTLFIKDITSNKSIDKVNDSLFEEFYDYYIKKLETHYYKYSTISEKMTLNRDLFINLSKEEKTQIILKLLDVTKSGSSQIDLKKIGCSVGTGIIASFALNRDEMTFIDQSITGFYEKRYKL
ncbi:type II CRISPR RNA-guided endonuclease Cas9 [Thiospirochaeta perfilievii]|uniref:CRISPR-associated endonuclease Cas9 n=1 Tax=Thiospirochaeta perfilievii TaxID=252967 RepID=A0A5C1QCQ8_9SPIO|nr:type II CRISPR RNA-guided endonuclease Cas9 [Thiospirochaeta perfilievii]QEN04729.1 type II CRISPR RNA-guided endonuclease Cas9 [Thiospirochaeta perfilievii]